ncbi:MAG: peptidase MA family metallohydrolase [Nitrospira sp. BO4]|jgi:tetratricopeptide (TPR) repeat protein|nr:peptidase MA family metallohydrolase [Nitrospira sp. BO4]
MYRRNITHILTPLGLGLALLVGYHLFLKPVMPPPTAQLAETMETVAPPPAPPQTRSAESEATPVRALDQSVIPPTPHEALLEAIRDEIEKHNLALAETRLKELPPAVLSDGKSKPFVAVLWNNLGLQQERLNGTKASIKLFKRAAEIDDSNPVILLNLAHAYWEQRDRALSIEFLTKLMKLVPEEPFPHLAMADLLQEQDELAEAGKHLRQAADRARQDPALQSYLAAVTAKIRRTQSVESHMTVRGSTHFVVKFDGEEDQNTWASVLEILEEAYREIGQKFGHFPSKPIIVVLHAKDTFQGATGSPAWADGLYDPNLGRIQIPTQGATTDRKWLTSVLRHEYVHALLHDRLGTSSGALPTWLNEGLAMQLAGDAWPELDHVMQGDIKVIPLTYLEGSWSALPASTSTVAYLEANSATRYLIERWGMARVDELLNAFQEKASVANALQNKLFVSYEQFHRQWLESFEHNRS